MPNSKLLICFVVFTIFLTACGKEEKIDNPIPGSVISLEGKVTDVKNTNPIQGAQLILTASSGSIKRANSSDEGKYTFQDLPNGTYTLEMVEPWGGTVSSKTRNLNFTGTKLTENFSLQIKNQTGFAAFQNGDKFAEIKTITGSDAVSAGSDIGAITVWSTPKVTTPIKDVLGKQLKGSDWLKASATCEATCNGSKAIFNIALQGLIPNGVYTMWLTELTEHHDVNFGFPRSTIKDMIPLKSGSTHLFKAAANGSYNFVGETNNCVLTNYTNGFAIYASYEMDNKAEESRAEKQANANEQQDATHLFIFY